MHYLNVVGLVKAKNYVACMGADSRLGNLSAINSRILAALSKRGWARESIIFRCLRGG